MVDRLSWRGIGVGTRRVLDDGHVDEGGDREGGDGGGDGLLGFWVFKGFWVDFAVASGMGWDGSWMGGKVKRLEEVEWVG
ncbi:hypothetical protein ACFX1T_031823 [Malus domestica]